MTREMFENRMKPLRRFLFSDWYTLMLIAVSALFIFTNQGVLGVVVMSTILAAAMVITDDLLPILEGIMVISAFAIKLKYSTPDFLKLWPFAFPIAICFFAHFFIYPPKLKKFSTMKGMIAASVAVTIGGIGVINPRTYFSPTSLFYMASLGFFMVILCSYVAASFDGEKEYNFEDRFCKMMLSPVAVITLCLIYEYFTRRGELADHLRVIPFQWRNNGSTLLMLSMPFAFYYTRRHFGMFLVGILIYGEILLTGSRGGLLFGAAELGICALTMIIIDKKHRKPAIITVLLGLIAVLFAGHYLTELIRYTIERMTNPSENYTRLELYKRGINDFKSSPLIGRGIAYMGNRDIHPSAKHTLCWYHCSLIQVAASCGIAGIAAYIYLNIQRIMTFKKNLSYFSLTLFLSFIGLEMMSLVNPGIFVPYPYLMIVSIYFIVMSQQNKGGRETITTLRKGE